MIVTTWRPVSETTPAIQPLPQNVAVEEPTSDQLGLEKFYSYAGKNTGAGSTLMNNLYAGNTVWSYNAFTNPSRAACPPSSAWPTTPSTPPTPSPATAGLYKPVR